MKTIAVRSETGTPFWSVMAVTIATALLFPISAAAERAKTFGEYTVHYNVLTTDILDPEVARSYRIVRSRQRAMINVTVLEQKRPNSIRPVRADVSVKASNLNAQMRDIEIRPLHDAEAIYYIGEFPVNHLETLMFSVTVSPQGSDQRFRFEFSESFYTE